MTANERATDANSAWTCTARISSAEIRNRTRGATSHIGGDPTPPELSSRRCVRPPFGTGIPGATRKCVGWTRSARDQGRVINIGTSTSASLRRIGLNSALSKISKNGLPVSDERAIRNFWIIKPI